MNYFVYIYFNDATPIYVGMGKNSRDLDHLNLVLKNKSLVNPHFENSLRKILSIGQVPHIKRVAENLSEQEAKELEIQLIAKYGRADLNLGPLTNLTNGGDGRCGWSKEQRDTMSKVHRGKISVIDQNGNRFKVDFDDSRYLSGELKGQNFGIKFHNTSAFNGMVQAKTPDGKNVRAKKSDPRFLSGELVGINKGNKMSSEQRHKISQSLKGIPKPKPPGFAAKMKHVAYLRELKKHLAKGTACLWPKEI